MPSVAQNEKKAPPWPLGLDGSLPMATAFDPSQLTPYPCPHGRPTKPAKYPHLKRDGVHLDAEGNEFPPFGGLSWGRTKYLDLTPILGSDGRKYTYRITCPVCRGEPAPADMTTPADE